ncbi:hypothetical protein [Aliamphritea hakodatensis]|uniref:hypothetical protein n=1 Tax=Aliamphritea hakodatensis TaxID=2895352 RepID=UPI0022FD6426|nr:hypothetical protein [Aliamphritea hakodatensis]
MNHLSRASLFCALIIQLSIVDTTHARYVPAAPIDPKDRQECSDHAKRLRAISKSIYDKAREARRRFYATRPTPRQSTAFSEWHSGVCKEGNDIFVRSMREENECHRQVRAYKKSVRSQNTLANQSKRVFNQPRKVIFKSYQPSAKKMAVSYVSKHNSDVAAINHVRNQYLKRQKQIALAKTAWGLINGQGGWAQRLDFAKNSSLQLNGLRKGNPLSKMLTSSGIKSVSGIGADLIKRFESGFQSFNHGYSGNRYQPYQSLLNISNYAHESINLGKTDLLSEVNSIRFEDGNMHPSVKIVQAIADSYVKYKTVIASQPKRSVAVRKPNRAQPSRSSQMYKNDNPDCEKISRRSGLDLLNDAELMRDQHESIRESTRQVLISMGCRPNF